MGQRDVEGIAYEHRQKIIKEEERMRNLKAEMQQQLDSRQVGQGWGAWESDCWVGHVVHARICASLLCVTIHTVNHRDLQI